MVHYWSSLGLGDGGRVLADLGLNVEEERLDLSIVNQGLNEELGQLLEIVR